MLNLAAWFANGERIRVPLPGARDPADAAPAIFRRVVGAGPWLTFLHGFPTCSWDWAKLEDTLAPYHRLLLFDFLGFGDSDKPPGHPYRLLEQADLVEALWRQTGVSTTGLIAHDYGASVAQELLARQAEGRLATEIRAVLFLNGGLYGGAYHPLRIQTLLARPGLGAVLGRLVTRGMFTRSFRALFAPDHRPTATELRDHWMGMRRRRGIRNYHRLLHYLAERREHGARWEAALDTSPIPRRFVWGLLDPVSGAPMAAEIRRRLPATPILELPTVGHYPQLEVPGLVSTEILRMFADRTLPPAPVS